MKKVLAVMLCGLILMAGLAGCQGCRPKEDPHEGLYGTYKMVQDGTETYKGSERLLTGVPRDVAIYIEDLKAKAGDTITITKETIKFSGGSIEAEFEYTISGFHLFYDRQIAKDAGFTFFIYSIDFETFTNYNNGSIIYQLETREYPIIDETEYAIRFFYLKV